MTQDLSDPEKAYWAAIVEVKCSWSIRRSVGRLPIPLMVLASGNATLAQTFGRRFGLSLYRQGKIWYAAATGEALFGLLSTLDGTHFKFRRKQHQHWLNLCGHIKNNRGARHKPLTPEVLSQRHKLVALAASADTFKEDLSRPDVQL